MRTHKPIDFSDAVLGAPAPQIEDPRFVALSDGDAIATPAIRRTAGVDGLPARATLSLASARAIHALATGAELRFSDGADPSFTLVSPITSVAYRTLSNTVLSTGSTPYPASAAIPFAARLILGPADEGADLRVAYLAFLTAMAEGAEQAQLDTLLGTAADELVVAIRLDLAADRTEWQSSAKRDGSDAPEFANDPAAVAVGVLLADPVALATYTSGGETPFATMRMRLGASPATESETIAVDTTRFFGPQQATAVRFMRAGRHILHHGPTGTGKSFVWELAMRELDPAFDPDTYPYFVHGSAGLEDIDLIGNYVLHADGTRSWTDGPLVRAMKDGKRLKVEELNRMSPAHLNVLLGAMDFGRITLARYDGQVVVAADGFAVDAMANIGLEYTGTEEIDPAVMRRFHVKVEYSFLSPVEEVALLRTRTGVAQRDADILVRIANSIRDAYRSGAGIDVDLYVSPASLLQTAELVADGATISEAIELTWLVEVARTAERRSAVRETIAAHLPRARR
jgi:MoxR-like ATPase